jgi:flavodoxin
VKALVIFDSTYGNTEKIARAIAGAIAASVEVKAIRVGEASLSDLESVDLLVVGSPTQGGRPTPAMQRFLSSIPPDALRNVSVSSFDTRVSVKGRGFGVRLLVGAFGYAAGRIAESLRGKGGRLAAPPEGFVVEGNEGPLKEGEVERAAAWARGLPGS